MKEPQTFYLQRNRASLTHLLIQDIYDLLQNIFSLGLSQFVTQREEKVTNVAGVSGEHHHGVRELKEQLAGLVQLVALGPQVHLVE